MELTPPCPPTWPPVQFACWTGAARAGARSTGRACLTGLAAGASSAITGAAINTAPKAAANERNTLFMSCAPRPNPVEFRQHNRINRVTNQKPIAAISPIS
jgi:hypothetical protein